MDITRPLDFIIYTDKTRERVPLPKATIILRETAKKAAPDPKHWKPSNISVVAYPDQDKEFYTTIPSPYDLNWYLWWDLLSQQSEEANQKVVYTFNGSKKVTVVSIDPERERVRKVQHLSNIYIDWEQCFVPDSIFHFIPDEHPDPVFDLMLAQQKKAQAEEAIARLEKELGVAV